MDKRHITTVGGITTTAHFDHEGKMHVVNSADLEKEFKFNKAMRNDGMGRTKDTRQVARIPLHVLFQLQSIWKANGEDPKLAMKKFLNDPDYKAFRTSEDVV